MLYRKYTPPLFKRSRPQISVNARCLSKVSENQHYNEAEYSAQRDELVKRIELRQQIVTLTVTSAGVLLGFSFKIPELALLFPPFSLFFCLMWVHNEVRSLQITDYIHNFENENTKLGWTTFFSRKQGQGSVIKGMPLGILAPGGIFILTALLSFGIGLSKWPTTNTYQFLMVCDVISIMLITWLVLIALRQRLERRKRYAAKK